MRAVEKLTAGASELMVAPTGSGKSVIQAHVMLAQQARGKVHYQVVPNTDIALGILKYLVPAEKMAIVRAMSFAAQQRTHEAYGVYTVKRLHNLMLQDKVPIPDSLCFDESHHSVDNTHVALWAMCGHCPRIGLTATAYRGTPEETAKLITAWGEPYVILKLRKAVEERYIARPNFVCWPLVNDDMIKVVNGEFQLSGVEGAIEDTLPKLVERIKEELCVEGKPKRMTMVRAPGVKSAQAITYALRQAGIPAVCMTGDETDVDGELSVSRQKAFDRCIKCEAILVQVKVVGEGTDLPVRVIVDLAPCMSPVAWMQAVGRQTRPVPDGEAPPLYIATNHNLTRHAYLWEGLIPPGQIRDAQLVWGLKYKPNRRSMARALGLEGFGKFTVAAVPLADGTCASLYALQTKDGLHMYAVLLHPCMQEPWYFQKTNEATGEVGTFEKNGHTIEYKKKRYGPWKRIASIPSTDGYLTVKADFVSDSMLDWWEAPHGAASVGLDAKHKPDGREFQALPILKNSRLRFRFED